MTIPHCKVYVRRLPFNARAARPWRVTVGHDESDWQRKIGRFETWKAAHAAVADYLWRVHVHRKLKEHI